MLTTKLFEYDYLAHFTMLAKQFVGGGEDQDLGRFGGDSKKVYTLQ